MHASELKSNNLRWNSWKSVKQKARVFCSMLFTVLSTGGNLETSTKNVAQEFHLGRGYKVWRTGRRTMGFLFKVLFPDVCSLWILPCIVFCSLVWGLLLDYICVPIAVQLLGDPSNAPWRASCCDRQVGIELVWGRSIIAACNVAWWCLDLFPVGLAAWGLCCVE
jgi:hypothetical protein